MTTNFKFYYIQGFPGHGSSTAESLKDLIGAESFSYDARTPEENIDRFVKEITSSDAHPIIIASSLGGWYAEQVAMRVPCDLILWNPSLSPDLTKYGIETKYAPVVEINRTIPRKVYQGKDDKIVDPMIAQRVYSKTEVLEGVEHRMTSAGLDMIVEKAKEMEC